MLLNKIFCEFEVLRHLDKISPNCVENYSPKVSSVKYTIVVNSFNSLFNSIDSFHSFNSSIDRTRSIHIE